MSAHARARHTSLLYMIYQSPPPSPTTPSPSHWLASERATSCTRSVYPYVCFISLKCMSRYAFVVYAFRSSLYLQSAYAFVSISISLSFYTKRILFFRLFDVYPAPALLFSNNSPCTWYIITIPFIIIVICYILFLSKRQLFPAFNLENLQKSGLHIHLRISTEAIMN